MPQISSDGFVMGATSLMSVSSNLSLFLKKSFRWHFLASLQFVIVVYGGNSGNLGHDCNRNASEACDAVFRARSTVFATLIFQILVYVSTVVLPLLKHSKTDHTCVSRLGNWKPLIDPCSVSTPADRSRKICGPTNFCFGPSFSVVLASRSPFMFRAWILRCSIRVVLVSHPVVLCSRTFCADIPPVCSLGMGRGDRHDLSVCGCCWDVETPCSV